MAQVAKLLIDNTKVAGDLTDYPVYVDLADMPALFWSTVANGGGDIRVFKSDGTTELPREVVSCDTSTETGELHFKYTGILSGSVDTEVQIHADGASADYAVTDTYGAENVWGSSYKLVYHLDSDVSQFDSTSNGNYASDSNLSFATAKLGDGGSFNGTSSQVLFNTVPNTGANPFSASFWLSTSVTGGNREIAYFGTNASLQGFDIYKNTSDKLTANFFGGGGIISSSASINTGSLIMGHVTYDGTNVRLYVNGSADGVSSSVTGNIGTTNKFIGKDSGGGNWWSGLLDEIRMTNTALSADWITTEYNNQNSPSTFYTATEPGVNVDSPTLSITATLNAPTLTLENPLALNAPTLSITTNLNVPSLTYIDPMAVTPPSLDMDLTLSLPHIKVGLWSNVQKNSTTWSNQSKNSTTWTNTPKS